MASINIFLITYLAIATLSIIARCILLSVCEYPRKQEYTAGFDVFSLVTQTAFGLWAFSLIS